MSVPVIFHLYQQKETSPAAFSFENLPQVMLSI